MKLAFAWLSVLLLALAGCAGTPSSNSSSPPRTQAAPAPTPGVTSTPTAPIPSAPTPPPTTGTPTAPPGTSPLAPTPTPTPTPTTPTTAGGPMPTTMPALAGTWSASLSSATGTPSLAFTVTLQQNADGTVTGTVITFTRSSPCFGTNTTVTGQVTGNTLTLVLTSALPNAGSNVVQIQLTASSSTVLTGTYVVTPATGNPACGVESGTVTLVHQ